jgi:hypothetical protein
MTTSSDCNSVDPTDLSALYFRDNANHRNAIVDNRSLQVAADDDDDDNNNNKNKKIIYAGPIQVRRSALVGPDGGGGGGSVRKNSSGSLVSCRFMVAYGWRRVW